MRSFILSLTTFTAFTAALPRALDTNSHEARSLVPRQGITEDGRCGPSNGLACRAGFCCSREGWCGLGEPWCGAGCQPGFGLCGTDTSPAPTTVPTTPATSTTTSTSFASPTGITQDGSCGVENGQACREGSCCSRFGWCGASDLYCGVGCQSGFGLCADDEVVSPVPTTNSTVEVPPTETATDVPEVTTSTVEVPTEVTTSSIEVPVETTTEAPGVPDLTTSSIEVPTEVTTSTEISVGPTLLPPFPNTTSSFDVPGPTLLPPFPNTTSSFEVPEPTVLPPVADTTSSEAVPSQIYTTLTTTSTFLTTTTAFTDVTGAPVPTETVITSSVVEITSTMLEPSLPPFGTENSTSQATGAPSTVTIPDLPTDPGTPFPTITETVVPQPTFEPEPTTTVSTNTFVTISGGTPVEPTLTTSVQVPTPVVPTSASTTATLDPSTSVVGTTLPGSEPAPEPTSTELTPALPSTTSAAPPAETSAPDDSDDDTIGTDSYTTYTGTGSVSDGWPAQSSWVSFEQMWSDYLPALSSSCDQFFVANNFNQENNDLRNAILDTASSSGVDARFILAVVLQESNGCVRAPTTVGSHPNPGLMQSHNGEGSCNRNSRVQVPCPMSEIEQMIADGTEGTDSGDGLVQILEEAGTTDVSRFYRAARIYNSGSIADSGDISQPGWVATDCYASDIANRLTGWFSAPSTCTL
ncbi:hypothetical protein MBLNU230_g2304t1 [Neophaeotheca triangularis]